MATQGHARIHTVELSLPGGARVGHVLLYPSVRFVGEPASQVARLTLKAAHKSWNKAGQLMPWLELAGAPACEQRVVAYTVGRDGRDRIDLRFELVTLHHAEGILVHVPALRVSTWAVDVDGIDAAARDLIRLEFARNKRLERGIDVLASQIFESVTASDNSVEPTFYTFGELRALQKEEAQSVVAELATKLVPPRATAFGMDAEVADLTRVVRSHHAVVVVGPVGCGKSALIGQAAFEGAFGEADLWRTTAGRMERALTEGGGWQSELTRAVAELAASGDWLYVDDLAELFEVGRYVGNETSIGEALRSPLADRELRFIAECTPAQLATLDARYPGLVPLFTQVDVSEPPQGSRAAIVHWRLEQASPGRVRSDGVREALRLQNRYQPYSGFPGRSVRFLEGLLQRVPGPIDGGAVLQGFCAESGLPRAFIDPSIPLDQEALQRALRERVLGQQTAVDAVVDVLVGIKAATTQVGRPMASLLFVGPTGVGKTEMAKALAHLLFGDVDRLTRFDMSEFASPGAVMNLIGGGGGQGLLTAAVRRQPFSVVLFDEVEKADASFFDLLLQVLGEGRLSDDAGRFADFCSTVVVLTSNIGAAEAARGKPGFQRESTDRSETYLRAVEAHFRPEFVNRIDRVLPFGALDAATLAAVLDLHLARLAARTGFERHKARLIVHEDARGWLAERGYRPEYGARELQRGVRDALLVPVSDALNQRVESGSCTVHVRLRDGAIDVGVQEHRRAKDAAHGLVRLRASAEGVARMRRVSFSVRSGGPMAELESALTVLRRSQRRRGEAFWRDAEQAARLARLEAVHGELADWFELAETTEIDVTLAAMAEDLEALPLMQEQSQALAERQNEVLHQFRGLMEPTPPVVLGLYGVDVDFVRAQAEHYTAVIQSIPGAAFRVVPHELWHLAEPLEGGAEYVWWDSSQPPAFGVLPRAMVGMELEVHGLCAADLLDYEDGTIIDEQVSPPVSLRVLCIPWSEKKKGPAHRPERLHRKGAFDGVQVHRIYVDGGVYDGDRDYDCKLDAYRSWLRQDLAENVWQALSYWAVS